MQELAKESEKSKASKIITFKFLSPISSVERNGNKGVVHLKNDEKIEFDLLIECSGFRQNQKFNELQQDDVGRLITKKDYLISDNIYTCGWARTGPKGDIADSMNEASNCAIKIHQDLRSKEHRLNRPSTFVFETNKFKEFKIK